MAALTHQGLLRSVLALLALGVSVQAQEWQPQSSEFHANGRFRREFEIRTEGSAEVILWAAGEAHLPRVRLESPGEGSTVQRATDSDPAAVVILAVSSAGTVQATLECDEARPVRYQVHVLALDADRRDELVELREEFAAMDVAGTVELRAACTGILEDILGFDGVVHSWSASELAMEVGLRAGRAGLDDLAARAFGHAAVFRAELLPPRSWHVLQLRVLEARALVRTQQIARARDNLMQVIPLVDELRGPASGLSLGARQDLARCLGLLGDLEAARNLYLDTVDIANQGLPEGDMEHIRLRHNAAVCCFELSDYWRSLQLDQEAMALLREQSTPIPKFERAIRMQLALTTRNLGTDVPEFTEGHGRVLESLAAELGEQHPDVLRLKSNFAGALSDDGQPERALPLAEDVLRVRLDMLGATHPDTLFSRLRVAQVLLRLGRLEEGLELQRETLRGCESTLPPGDPLLRRSRAAVARTLAYSGRTRDAAGAYSAWITSLLEEVRVTQVSSWRARRERVAALKWDFLSLAVLGQEFEQHEDDAHLRTAMFELLETARAASAAGPLRIGADDPDLELARYFDEQGKSREVLGDLVAATAGASVPSVATLSAARAELDASERRLARALAERGLLPFESVDKDTLCELLTPSAAAVSFTAFDLRLARPLGVRPAGKELYFQVALLTNDGRLRVRIERSLCALEDAIADWRAAIGVPVDTRPALTRAERRRAESEAGARILDLVFGDWLTELDPAVNSLFVCLDGALALVPLDALSFEGSALGDRFRMRHLVAFDELTQRRERSGEPARLLAIGGLEYDGLAGSSPAARTFSTLPSSAEEVHAVATLFDAEGARESILLEGGAATQSAVRDALARSTHAFIATHGYFDDALLLPLGGVIDEQLTEEQVLAAMAPLSLCGLALSRANELVVPNSMSGRVPGIWTGEEIAGEDLRSLELVVLSACDTNRGLRRGGVGVLTLSTALRAAGVQSSLTSLWRVKTDYGRDLVEQFFREYLAGSRASDALWKAKLHLRDERGLPTRFWAGWTLSGDAQGHVSSR